MVQTMRWKMKIGEARWRTVKRSIADADIEQEEQNAPSALWDNCLFWSNIASSPIRFEQVIKMRENNICLCGQSSGYDFFSKQQCQVMLPD